MAAITRYQAVREALSELPPTATDPDVGKFVKEKFGFDFDSDKTLAVYIRMVKHKMSRSPRKDGLAGSGQYKLDVNLW